MAGTLVVDLIGVPRAFYFQSADPAVANPTHLRTGIHWIDTTASPYVWKRRNAANDGWDMLGKIRSDAEFNTAIAATPPQAHAASHQNGGGDEISIAGLSGVSADPQVPITENVQDIVGAMLTDNSDLDWNYDDGAGTEVATIKGGASALNPVFTTLTDGATVTWATAGARVNNAKVTLAGNRTLDITGEVDGASGILIVIQDGTGSRTLALPGSSKVIDGGAGAIALTTTAGAIDILSWVYDGTNFYWTKGLNYT